MLIDSVILIVKIALLGICMGGTYRIFQFQNPLIELLKKWLFRDPRMPPYMKINTPEGKLLEGPDKMLGDGAYGIVTRFKLNGEHVAVKTLKNLKNNTSLIHEIKLLNEANPHPNILKYITSFKLDRNVFLVTEYMQGSLRDLLDKNPNLFWNVKLSVAIQVAKGIAYLHNLNSSFVNRKAIIHQDLKTANILVDRLENDPNIQVKICDFGIARQADQINLPFIGEVFLEVLNGRLGGTYNYCAPEIYNGFRCEIKSDVFSEGIILCEIATSKPPNRTSKEIANGTFNDFYLDKNSSRTRMSKTSFFSKSNEEVSKPTYPRYSFFGPIIDNCIKPNPKDRYSAQEVLEKLQKVTLI